MNVIKDAQGNRSSLQHSEVSNGFILCTLGLSPNVEVAIFCSYVATPFLSTNHDFMSSPSSFILNALDLYALQQMISLFYSWARAHYSFILISCNWSLSLCPGYAQRIPIPACSLYCHSQLHTTDSHDLIHGPPHVCMILWACYI